MGRGSSDGAAGAEGLGERAFVEIVEFTSDGKPMRQLRETNRKFLETLGEVVGGCLAFQRRVHGQDDLIDAAGRDALDQLVDAQILRADAFKGRWTAVFPCRERGARSSDGAR